MALGALKPMSAKFPGRCRKCGGAVSVGEKIIYDTDVRKVEHAVCPENPQVAPARPVVRLDPETTSNLVRAEEVLNLIDREREPIAAQHADLSKKRDAVVREYQTRLTEAGYCSCDGRGSVWHYSCDYPCDCSHAKAKPGWRALPGDDRATDRESCKVRDPGLRDLAEEGAKLEAAVAALWRKLENLDARAIFVKTAQKGYEVVVARGRKVPRGVRGIVVGTTQSEYGPRIGFADADGTVHWTAYSNVDVTGIPRSEAAKALDFGGYAPEARPPANAERRMGYNAWGRRGRLSWRGPR